MTTSDVSNFDESRISMDTYLAPIEKPRGMMMGLVYKMSKRQFGKVLTPLKVVYARLPLACVMPLAVVW